MKEIISHEIFALYFSSTLVWSNLCVNSNNIQSQQTNLTVCEPLIIYL